MANDNEADAAIAGLKTYNQMFRAETKVLMRTLTGAVTDHQAVNQILDIVDGPQRAEADRLFEKATGQPAIPPGEGADARALEAEQISARPSRRRRG